MTPLWRHRASALTFALLLSSGCVQRVRGPHGIEGGRVADGFFYVVPVEGGVVLVDTGEQPDGAALRDAIAGRPVLALLVTHAHHDHYAAAHTFGEVPCHVGPDDIDRMQGKTQHQGEAQRAFREQNGGQDLRPPLPARLVPAPDGTQLVFGGDTFTALALPGHTPGSTAWTFRDGLFGGDAAMASGGGIAPIDARFSDDPQAATEVVRRLDGRSFSWLADGHVGLTLLR